MSALDTHALNALATATFEGTRALCRLVCTCGHGLLRRTTTMTSATATLVGPTDETFAMSRLSAGPCDGLSAASFERTRCVDRLSGARLHTLLLAGDALMRLANEPFAVSTFDAHALDALATTTLERAGALCRLICTCGDRLLWRTATVTSTAFAASTFASSAMVRATDESISVATFDADAFDIAATTFE